MQQLALEGSGLRKAPDIIDLWEEWAGSNIVQASPLSLHNVLINNMNSLVCEPAQLCCNHSCM